MNLAEQIIPPDQDQLLDESFWRRHVEAFKTMNISKIGYCKQHDLAYHRFLYWCGKFTKNESKLLPVRINSSEMAQAICAIELPRGGRVLVYSEQILTKLLFWLEK